MLQPERHHGVFGRLPHNFAAVGRQLRIVAEGHRARQQLRIAVKIRDRHPVLGQGAGLIRADHLGAAERFDRGQLPDDGVALGEVGHADGKHDGHHGGEALRNGGDRQAYGEHEGVQNRRAAEVAAAQQVEHKDERADGEHADAQHVAELVQLLLERRRLFPRFGEGAGNLAHFRLHAGRRHHALAAPVDHVAAHVGHVEPVAERNLLAAGCGKRLRRFFDGDGLARQGRFVDFQVGHPEQPHIRRNGVPRLQQNHVPRHQRVGIDLLNSAAPPHFRAGRRHGLKGLDGFFGFALLHDAQDGVQHNDQKDHGHVHHLADDPGKDGRHDQDDNHRVGHLLEEPARQALLLGVRKPVGTEALPSAGGFLPRKAVLRAAEGLENLFFLLLIVPHKIPPFYADADFDADADSGNLGQMKKAGPSTEKFCERSCFPFSYPTKQWNRRPEAKATVVGRPDFKLLPFYGTMTMFNCTLFYHGERTYDSK